MMFWILCAALIAVVTISVLMPFLRRRREARPVAAYDLRVYRDQLREVERDLERGVINSEEAARLRTEIGRKVLEADRRLADARGSAGPGATIGAVVVLVAVLAGAVALYLREGTPRMPDQPLAGRFAEAQAIYANRPSQAEAEAQAPARQATPEPDETYQTLIAQLREAVARNPDDPQGLALLATHEMRLGNPEAARDAQARLVALQGEQPDADDLIRLATLMTEAAGGMISAEAEQHLARALQIQPDNPQGRYLLGVLQIQTGRPDRAFPIWRRLLEEGPETAPWIASIRNNIGDLAWLAGVPDYQPPTPRTGPGPDADAIAAAGDMTDEERQQMVEGMVAQLETRLAEQGGSPEEWGRLISSLAVIGQQDRAALIWAEAQERFAASPEALATVREGAEQAGVAQ